MKGGGFPFRGACASWRGTLHPGAVTTPKRGEVPEWSIGAVSKTVVGLRPPWVRIPPSPPLQSLSGHCVSASLRCDRLEQPGLRSDDPDLAFRHLDTLGQGAQVVAAEAAAG